MRIAVVVTFFPSLSQTFVLNQVTGLIDRGHEVDVYAAGPEPDERGAGERWLREVSARAEQRDVRRYRLSERVRYEPPIPGNVLRRVVTAVRVLAWYYGRSPRAALRALDVVRRGRRAASLTLLFQGAPFAGRPTYDALLCHFGPNGRRVTELRAAGLVRGRVLTAFHGYDLSRYLALHGDRVYDDLFARGDLFLPVSHFWRRRLIALGCPAERIVVHPMGVDLRRFAFEPRRPDGGEVRLLTVARLVEKKGVEYGIRAVAALRAAGLPVRYRIVGNGPLRGSLERLAAELGVREVVRFEGERDQEHIIRAMREAHLFVAPSVTARDGDMEGIPVSLMEAMATGLPVVSTYHSGIPELVQDGTSGFLVPERDVEALAMVLRYLVVHPSRWPEMGAAGRVTVERERDMEVLNDRLEALLAGRGVGMGAGALRVRGRGVRRGPAVRRVPRGDASGGAGGVGGDGGVGDRVVGGGEAPGGD